MIGATGWINAPGWVDDALQVMPTPFICDTQYYHDLKKLSQGHVDIKPWELEIKALGKRLPAHYQARGTCVSQGFSRAVQFVSLVDMVLGNQPEEWIARVHPGSIYAASRVEIGGGEISGDGSVGAWAARAVSELGVLYRIKYLNGKYDLTADQDELFSVEWGKRGRGVPDDLEPSMREHPISDASMVTSADEFVLLQYDCKPVPICSNRGFTTKRDAQGFCKPSGTWNHCMLAFGLLKIKGGRLGAIIWQSWGKDSPTGPDKITLETGEEVQLSEGTFLVELDVINKMLGQEDSFALTGIKGWEPTPLLVVA